MSAAFLSLASAFSPQQLENLPRRQVLRAACAFVSTFGAASAATAADSSWAQSVGLAPPERTGLQAKWLEKVRILLQDEADAIQYGGQEGLAPGGPPSSVPALQLIPIVQMQAALKELQPKLADFDNWDSVLLVLERAPFETVALKRIFNAYADNIYYVSGDESANAYLLGGATPSSKQTTQYLLRNEILKQLGEIKDEIKYQRSIEQDKRETDVAAEYMQNTLNAFEEYLKLVAPAERQTALEAVYGDDVAKKIMASLKYM